MDHANAQRFTEVCKRLGLADERVRGIFDDLKERYLEVHRSYHNLLHIDRMLSWLDASADGDDTVELAIWFHAAVYEPLGSHNEAKSAQYFADSLGSFIGGSMGGDVERLILATDPKLVKSGCPTRA